jgi:4-hydroxymandelate oxidase
VVWGLAIDGEDGVAAVLDLLTSELRRAMALCGAANVAAITRDLIVAARS